MGGLSFVSKYTSLPVHTSYQFLAAGPGELYIYGKNKSHALIHYSILRQLQQ